MTDHDEKQALIEAGLVELELPAPQQTRVRQRHSLRNVLIFLCQLFAIGIAVNFLYTNYRPRRGCGKKHAAALATERVSVDNNTTKVTLEAHIMSKCPDAKDCLQQLVVPTMARISDKVDFTLSYIGSVDPHSDEISCKHGPSECLGNIIQLCAAKVYPDPKLYLGFANCMISQYSDIPDRELVEGCAMEHGIDFQKLNHCISQEGHGIELLRKSVEHSRENHVTTSCTVRLEGRVRCVRDGGEWYDCPGGSSVSDLVAQIDELYNKRNSI